MNVSISRNGVEIGEWTEEQVRAFYKDRQLLPTDHYWREGMTVWAELSRMIKPPPPSAIRSLPQVVKPTMPSTTQIIPIENDKPAERNAASVPPPFSKTTFPHLGEVGTFVEKMPTPLRQSSSKKPYESFKEFDARRLYALASYHRSFWMALAGFAISIIALIGLAEIPSDLGSPLRMLPLCASFITYGFGVLVAWAWLRTRIALYGLPLGILILLICAAIPGVILLEMIIGAFKVRSLYRSENVSCGFFGIPSKAVVCGLKP